MASWFGIKIRDISKNFDINEAKIVKEIEKKTRHDVKAVEYYLRIKFEDIGLDRTIIDPTRKWPKRRKTNAPKGLKRLWKHIKKMKF